MGLECSFKLRSNLGFFSFDLLSLSDSYRPMNLLGSATLLYHMGQEEVQAHMNYIFDELRYMFCH